jgi:Concanavalin A-like lectin/glucanases superfamily
MFFWKISNIHPKRSRIVAATAAVALISVLPTMSAKAAAPAPVINIDPGMTTSFVAGMGTAVSKINLNPGVVAGQGTAIAVTYGTDATTNNAPFFDFNGASLVGFPVYDFGTKFTVTAWVQPRDKKDIQTIFANAGQTAAPSGFKLGFNTWRTNDKLISVEAGNGTKGDINKTAVAQVVDNQWQQISYAIDLAPAGGAAPTVQIFRNGSAICSTGTLPLGIGHNQLWNIGAMMRGTYGLNARLGKLKVYNTALSQADLIADFDASKSTYGVTATASLVPTNVSPATITGTPKVGEVQTSTTGTWTNGCAIAYTYKWATSATRTGTYKDIAKATASSYTVAAADAGKWLRLAVIATSNARSGTSYAYVQVEPATGKTKKK